MNAVSFVAYCGELSGLPRVDAMQRAHEVLYYVGLGEARYREIDTYSTGMKQRIKLAQALVHDPDLLFLDEPTNGMDPKGRDEMLELVRDLGHNKGVSLILSSHLLPDVEYTCDHLIVLDKGRIATSGRIGENRGGLRDGVRNSVGFAWHPRRRSSGSPITRATGSATTCRTTRCTVAAKQGHALRLPVLPPGRPPRSRIRQGPLVREFDAARRQAGRAHRPARHALLHRHDVPGRVPRTTCSSPMHGSWNRTTKQGYNVMRATVDASGKVEAEAVPRRLPDRREGRPADVGPAGRRARHAATARCSSPTTTTASSIGSATGSDVGAWRAARGPRRSRPRCSAFIVDARPRGRNRRAAPEGGAVRGLPRPRRQLDEPGDALARRPAEAVHHDAAGDVPRRATARMRDVSRSPRR